MNHCCLYGNVLTLFISSIALHLIAERLVTSTADAIFDYDTVQTDRILTSRTGTIVAPSLPYLHTLDWLDYIVGHYLC